MDYSKYTVEELVLDDYFRKWVYSELPAEDTFWEIWVTGHPDREDLVNRARFVVNALDMKHEVLSERRVLENVRSIVAEVEREEERPRNPYTYYGLGAAASLLLAVGLFWYFVQRNNTAAISYETIVEAVKVNTLEKVNNAESPQTIVLSDGSSITLQPGSRLTYPAEFGPDKREVILSGEAFFDITRQPERPFIVYANEIVTRVLGTSFYIKSYENDTDITVRVVTGKVSVLSAKAMRENRNGGSASEGLVLTPNQMAVYARNPERLTRSLVDNPGIVKSSLIKSSDYNFEDTPVAEVFQALEEGYGVPIVYNAEQLASCTITAPLENENLYEKLDMICKVIRATYEVVDAQVIITSRGCE